MIRKNAFIANQENFICRKFYELHSKPPFLLTKTSFAHAFLRCSQKIPIFTNQKFSIYRKLTNSPQKLPFYIQKLFICTSLSLQVSKTTHIFTNQKFFFCPNLSLLLSKATLFHPPLPISTPLNLLFAKKHSSSFSLRSKSLRCKAGASHRFKSLPAIPGEVAAFRKTGYLMNAGHFRKNHVSTGDLNRPRSPEVRKPLVYFWFFSYTRKE